MRVAGLLMVAIGIVLIIVPVGMLGMALSGNAPDLAGMDLTLKGLFALLTLLGAGLVWVGLKAAFPKP